MLKIIPQVLIFLLLFLLVSFLSVPTTYASSGMLLFGNTSKGGYSHSKCRSVDVKPDLSTLSAEVTCQGNLSVRMYKIDCGNGTSFLIRGGRNFVRRTCTYSDPKQTYRIQCLVSKRTHISSNDFSTSSFMCRNNLSFNGSISSNYKYINSSSVGDSSQNNASVDGFSTFTVITPEYLENQKYLELQQYNTRHINYIIGQLESVFKKYTSDKERLFTLQEKDTTFGVNDIMGTPQYLPRTGIQYNSYRKYIETQLPDNINTFAGVYNTQLSFWKQKLPLVDRNENRYIVIPSNGLIVPLSTIAPETQYYKDMSYGKHIDINTYLTNGVSTYAGTEITKFGEVGNPLIYGHSSYWKHKKGRYKTHFQRIIGLEKNVEIWVYSKQPNGLFKRYTYITVESYETAENDFSVLSPGMGRNLTLMTCSPIGGSNKRWIVKAQFKDDEKIGLTQELYGLNITPENKIEIETFIQEIRKLPKNQRKKFLLRKFIILQKFYHSTHSQSFINYFNIALSKEYFS